MTDVRHPGQGNPGQGSLGPSTDQFNQPVIDPTKNVGDLVAASERRLDDLRTADEKLRLSEFKRQDDLREMESSHLRQIQERENPHIRELLAVRSEYGSRLDAAETQRIDAIRAVDVGN